MSGAITAIAVTSAVSTGVAAAVGSTILGSTMLATVATGAISGAIGSAAGAAITGGDIGKAATAGLIGGGISAAAGPLVNKVIPQGTSPATAQIITEATKGAVQSGVSASLSGVKGNKLLKAIIAGGATGGVSALAGQALNAATKDLSITTGSPIANNAIKQGIKDAAIAQASGRDPALAALSSMVGSVGADTAAKYTENLNLARSIGSYAAGLAAGLPHDVALGNAVEGFASSSIEDAQRDFAQRIEDEKNLRAIIGVKNKNDVLNDSRYEEILSVFSAPKSQGVGTELGPPLAEAEIDDEFAPTRSDTKTLATIGGVSEESKQTPQNTRSVGTGLNLIYEDVDGKDKIIYNATTEDIANVKGYSVVLDSKGNAVDLETAKSYTDTNVSPTNSDIKAIFGLGTPDPSSPYKSLFGSGSTGGEFDPSGFAIFALDQGKKFEDVYIDVVDLKKTETDPKKLAEIDKAIQKLDEIKLDADSKNSTAKDVVGEKYQSDLSTYINQVNDSTSSAQKNYEDSKTGEVKPSVDGIKISAPTIDETNQNILNAIVKDTKTTTENATTQPDKNILFSQEISKLILKAGESSVAAEQAKFEASVNPTPENITAAQNAQLQAELDRKALNSATSRVDTTVPVVAPSQYETTVERPINTVSALKTTSIPEITAGYDSSRRLDQLILDANKADTLAPEPAVTSSQLDTTVVKPVADVTGSVTKKKIITPYGAVSESLARAFGTPQNLLAAIRSGAVKTEPISSVKTQPVIPVDPTTRPSPFETTVVRPADGEIKAPTTPSNLPYEFVDRLILNASNASAAASNAQVEASVNPTPENIAAAQDAQLNAELAGKELSNVIGQAIDLSQPGSQTDGSLGVSTVPGDSPVSSTSSLSGDSLVSGASPTSGTSLVPGTVPTQDVIAAPTETIVDTTKTTDNEDLLGDDLPPLEDVDFTDTDQTTNTGGVGSGGGLPPPLNIPNVLTGLSGLYFLNNLPSRRTQYIPGTPAEIDTNSLIMMSPDEYSRRTQLGNIFRVARGGLITLKKQR